MGLAKLSTTLILLCHLTACYSLSCVLPAFMEDVPKCTVNVHGGDDCCAGFKCVKAECVSSVSLPGVETPTATDYAVVAHQIVMQADDMADKLTAALNAAAEKIAAADKNLRNLTAAAADKVKKAADNVKVAAADASKKAAAATQSLKGSAKKKIDEIKQGAKTKYADAKNALDKKKEELDQMYKDATADPKGDKAVAAIESFLFTENKASGPMASGGYDRSKYAPSSKKVDSKDTSTGSPAGTGTGTGTGGFDWQKFVPAGMGGAPGTSKTVNMKETETAGGDATGPGAGGFDWQKFVPPGMGGAQPGTSKTVDMKEKEAAAAGHATGHGTGGFDWQKFVPPGMGGAPGTGPAPGSGTSKVVNMRVNEAGAGVPGSGYYQPGAYQPAPGAWQPKTPYFDPSKLPKMTLMAMLADEKESAKENAEQAAKMAGIAADAAESLAAKLMAAAAHLRKGAAELKKKADDSDSTGNETVPEAGDNAETASFATFSHLASGDKSSSAFGLSPFLLTLIVCASVLGVVYYRRKNRGFSYESI